MSHRLRMSAFLVLIVFLAAATGAVAKPLYCNYQCYEPYYHGPGDYCTCPSYTPEYGLVTTCQEWFWSVCYGAFSAPPSEAAVDVEIEPVDESVTPPAPAAEPAAQD